MDEAKKALLIGVGLVLAPFILILAVLFGGAVFRHFILLSDEVALLFQGALFLGFGALFLLVGAKIYHAWTGPQVLREEEQKPIRVLSHRGRVTILPQRELPGSLTSYAPHYSERNAIDTTLAEPEEQDALPVPLPQARSVYELMDKMHGADKILLGYDETGPVWLEIDQLLSIAMAGNSGRGKSRALLWLVAQFLRQHIETTILDGKGDLRRWISTYHPVAYSMPEQTRTVDGLISAIDQRLAQASVNADVEFPPLLVVMDELDLIAARAPRAIDLVELLTKKSRSVNVHGIYSNQSVPADLVGGVKTRGVIVSRICFYCDDEAARLIGVRKDNGGTDLLQRIGPPEPEGLAVARTAAFGWKIIAFPYASDQMIPWLLGVHALPPIPMKADRVTPSLPLSYEEAPKIVSKVPSPEERERERIVQTIQDNPGASASAICSLAGISNNKVALVKRIKEELAAQVIG